MSNLWLSAWCLIMATVRVGGETGLDTISISPGACVGEEGADIAGRFRRREGGKRRADNYGQSESGGRGKPGEQIKESKVNWMAPEEV